MRIWVKTLASSVITMKVAMCLLAIVFAPAWAGETIRVSIDSSGVQGNDNSWQPTISSDGRYVAFYSLADNLVPDDTMGWKDVFVHDCQAGETTRVSVSTTGAQANQNSSWVTISGDGRYVAFESLASNLVADDTNGEYDVFVHDRQTAETERVSYGDEGEGNNGSFRPHMSLDGQHVAFQSLASNLIPEDTNGCRDVFVADRHGAVTRVSVNSGNGQGDDGSGLNSVSISSDGRCVAFDSCATNLVDDDTNGQWDIFVRDRLLDLTERVSVSSSGEEGNNKSDRPAVSSDGRYVAFESVASNLVPDDMNERFDVFVHDRQTGETERISVSSSGEEGNNSSTHPSISSDGRYVAFDSAASNLVPGDTNNSNDVFLHDRQIGETLRVSISSTSEQGNGLSYYPAISSDGRLVAFESASSNLVQGDTNGSWDVFVYICDPPCSGDLDGDGFRNLTDFTLFAAAYGTQLGDPNYDPDADLNGDGFVNVTDFTHFAAVYGVACP
jgi:Tol biopolymer transport system component